jgi:hypothetical protein
MTYYNIMKIYLYVTSNNLYIFNKMVTDPSYLDECGIMNVSWDKVFPNSVQVQIPFDDYVRLLDANKIKVY